MKVSDAVVEVAARAAYAEAMKDHKPNPGGNWKKEMLSVRERYRANARAALEAALPMAVGEAVAYARVHNKTNPHYHDVVPSDSQEAEMWAYDLIPLYTLTNIEDAP